MNNKVLIKLTVPEINTSFDVFVPVNEALWKIKKMLIRCIYDLSNTDFDSKEEFILINKENSRIYKNSEIVIETDIRNATELLLISQRQ